MARIGSDGHRAPQKTARSRGTAASYAPYSVPTCVPQPLRW
ncbi:hypothetical protein CPT_Sycamore_056 [Streptomyces phage Sycamore]|uniref:Uncharacterized protein n=1 Tax=Streptomyces phage Sycamore TaxID=2767589 RepID=A0A873WJC8_9CAUD|nr:hypothetical protein CPT_Sycamore_056 [Streptomyces phage Sycamore]